MVNAFRGNSEKPIFSNIISLLFIKEDTKMVK
jgi:hypothetical protein